MNDSEVSLSMSVKPLILFGDIDSGVGGKMFLTEFDINISLSLSIKSIIPLLGLILLLGVSEALCPRLRLFPLLLIGVPIKTGCSSSLERISAPSSSESSGGSPSRSPYMLAKLLSLNSLSRGESRIELCAGEVVVCRPPGLSLTTDEHLWMKEI